MKDDHEKRPAGAPAGNKNAEKDDDEALSAVLHLRVKPEEKAAWNAQARKEGKKLAVWVREHLNSLVPVEPIKK